VIAACDIPAVTRVQAVCQRIIRALCSLSMGRRGAFGFLAGHTVRELPRGLQNHLTALLPLALSLHLLDVVQHPALINGSLLGAVEAEHHEERLAFPRQYPVVLLTGGGLGREVHIHRPVGVLLELLVVGPAGGNVRPDLIRGQSVAVFPFGTGSFTSESPYMSPFWPRKPEVFPVLAEVGNRFCASHHP
jgi:hypothetical protein